MDAAFLAEIIAAPDDDAPRLVYADWLDEHGEPERAEFIRCGVEMGRHTDCPTMLKDYARRRPHPMRCGLCPYCRCRRRCDELKSAHDFWRWTQPLALSGFSYYLDVGLNERQASYASVPTAPNCMHFVLSRGFVESVTCTAADWLAHGHDVVRAQPVTRVTLADKRPVGLPEGWSWMPVYGGGDAGQIPWEIAEHLPGRRACWVAGGVLYYRVGATEQAALDALSAAAPAWARAAAPAGPARAGAAQESG